MKDKQGPGRRKTRTHSAAEAILALPRHQKRLIMLAADAVAMPLAFWAALALKFDRLDPVLERTRAYFLLTVAAGLLIFSLLGLYRAVIRFMGPRAMLTVVVGVTASVFIVVAFDRLVWNSAIPVAAFDIFWSVGLLYALGSRFCVRYLFSHTLNGKSAARVAILGGGD